MGMLIFADEKKGLQYLKLQINMFNVSWVNEAGIATGHRLEDRGVGVRVPVPSRIFSMSSTPALGPAQPRIRWVSVAVSPGRGVKLTTHFQLVPRSRKCGCIHLLRHTP
jgi:hypothetical protein